MSRIEAHLTGVSIGGTTPALLIVRADSPEELLVILEQVKTVAQSGARELETITTVMFREHTDKNGKTTPLIDLYPDWRGDYGQFKFLSMYLNTPQDIAQFEAQSGVTLDSMPLYDGQGARKRVQAQPHRAEVKCKPFGVYRVQGKEITIDDRTERRWEFAGYANPDPEQPPKNVPERRNVPVWWKSATRTFARHRAFAGKPDVLTLVLKGYLNTGQLKMDTPPDEAIAFLKQEHPEK